MIREEFMIRSGRTKRVSDALERWYNKEFKNVDTEWLWGYKESALKKLLDVKTIVPFRSFMIRYLLEVHEEERKELADVYKISYESVEECIENLAKIILTEAKEKKVKKYENASDTVKKITDIVFDDFVSNGFAENGLLRGSIYEVKGKCKECWDRTKLLRKITADRISEEDLWVFGFGLNIDYQDISFFLRKALKRTDYNLWNETEFLLYLTYHFAPEDRYTFFKNLKSVYERTEAKECGWLREDNFSTVVIGDKSEEVVKKLKDKNDIFVMNENGEWPEEVLEFLSYYKFINQNPEGYIRTIKKEAAKLLENFDDNIKDQVKEWKDTLKEEKSMLVNCAYGSVKIYYDPSKGLNIPKGTLFYKIYKKNNRRVGFESIEDVLIEPVEQFEKDVKIPVICMKPTQKTKNPEELIGFVPKNTEFKSTCENLLSIYNKSQLKAPTNVQVGEETYVAGTLYAKCNSGTIIEEKVEFIPLYQMDVEASFVSTQAIDGRACAEIEVYGISPGEEASLNEITDCSIEGWKDKFQITNGKIGVNKKKEQASGGKLYNYLYHAEKEFNPYTIDYVLGEKYGEKLELILKDTQLSSTKLSQIKTQKAENITRNDILTLSFLSYMSEIEKKKRDKKEQEKYQKMSTEKKEDLFKTRRSDFVNKTDQILEKCGFYIMYAPNPYDSLLILLLSSSEAIDAYRNLWNQLVAKRTNAEEE